MPMEAQGFRSKRAHSEVDDCDECLPISKRINRLHIEGQQNARSDERFACSHEEQQLSSLGANNNQMPLLWQDRMSYCPQPNGFPSPPVYTTTSLSDSLLNGAAQYHQHQPSHLPLQVSMYHQAIPSGYGASPHSPDGAHSPGFPTQQQQQFSQHSPVLNVNPQFLQGPETQDVHSMDYDPELDEQANPHYFHINHVLFDAHCQRARREGFPLGPDTLP